MFQSFYKQTLKHHAILTVYGRLSHAAAIKDIVYIIYYIFYDTKLPRLRGIWFFIMWVMFFISDIFCHVITNQDILEFTSSSPKQLLSNYWLTSLVPHLTQLCPGTTYPACHHMSVYRRVCSAPAGSLLSHSAESLDAVQARTVRNSEYQRKSRSPLSEKLTPVPQTSRRLFLKM